MLTNWVLEQVLSSYIMLNIVGHKTLVQMFFAPTFYDTLGFKSGNRLKHDLHALLNASTLRYSFIE